MEVNINHFFYQVNHNVFLFLPIKLSKSHDIDKSICKSMVQKQILNHGKDINLTGESAITIQCLSHSTES